MPYRQNAKTCMKCALTYTILSANLCSVCYVDVINEYGPTIPGRILSFEENVIVDGSFLWHKVGPSKSQFFGSVRSVNVIIVFKDTSNTCD